MEFIHAQFARQAASTGDEPTDGSKLWILGVLLAINTAMMSALGDNLIKRSFTLEKNARANGLPRTPVWKRPLWSAGMFVILVVVSVSSMVSYSLADGSLLIPFAGLHIVFNMIFAYYMNDERFLKVQVALCGVIMIGITLVAFGGNHGTETHSLEKLESLLKKKDFYITTVSIIVIVLVLFTLSRKGTTHQIRCVTTGMTSGSLGGGTQVFTKLLSESGGKAFKSWDDFQIVFSNPVVYVGLIGTLSFGLCQFVALNIALKKYKAFYVSPFVSSSLIIVGSVYSAIVFEEWNDFTSQQWSAWCTGVATCVIGVLCLAFSTRDEEEDENEATPGAALEPLSQY